MRGIVVGTRVSADGGTFSMHGAVQLNDVLEWLLYWDQIVFTGVSSSTFGTISGNQPADVEALEDLGIFRTEFVDVAGIDPTSLPDPIETGVKIFGLSGNQFAVASAAARLELSRRLSGTPGEIWTIGQSGGETLTLPASAGEGHLIDVQLVNCLPVPVPGTAFRDILDFKAKYSEKLRDLRLALERLRQDVLVSTDEKRALEVAVDEISGTVRDVMDALDEGSVAYVGRTIGLYTTNPSLGFWGALGGTVAAAQGLPMEIGAAAGLAGPTLVRFLKRAVSGADLLPEGTEDFAYVYEAAKELKAS